MVSVPHNKNGKDKIMSKNTLRSFIWSICTNLIIHFLVL